MKIFTFHAFHFFAFAFCFLSAFGAPKADNGWVEAWRDDFNGSRIDEKYWTRIDQGKPDWCKNMSTRKDLVEVKNGNLILWGKKNNDLKADPRTDASPTQWPFDCPQDLRLDQQLGGNWVGAVDLNTLPVATYVDWVRWLVREDDPRLKGRKPKRADKAR